MAISDGRRLASSNNALVITLIAVVTWLLLGVLFLMQGYFYTVSFGREMDWAQQAPYRLSSYVAWGLLTLPLYRLSQFLKSKLQPTWQLVVGHLPVAIAVAFFHRLFSTLIELSMTGLMSGELPSIMITFSERTVALVGGTVDGMVTYLVIMLIYTGYDGITKAKEQQQKVAKVQQQLTQSRLDVLQSQLQPHFLFNTLNGIVTLIHESPNKAELMVTRLAHLLRFSLDHALGNTVLLRDELEALEDYLTIEKMRLGDRLTYQFQIDENCMMLEIPTLILQPIVENAIRHGIAPFNRPGKLLIIAKMENKFLLINVEDSGDGFKKNDNRGLGLKNSRTRLSTLFDEQGKLLIAASSLGGTKIQMILPASEQDK